MLRQNKKPPTFPVGTTKNRRKNGVYRAKFKDTCYPNASISQAFEFIQRLFFSLTDIETEEGKTAEKRVKVYCGICKETRYYSIHRGVTRIGGVVLACEACRHYYQKFKRKPCILRCRDKDSGSCHVLGDNSKNRCKACWIAHLLRICPFPEDLYLHLQGHLPNKLKVMGSKARYVLYIQNQSTVITTLPHK
ncbi:hypothetical protein E2C01_020406 [Portunus trituberculatus]|uniref:Nuclear receptor domain-containing protein n=1 Tax=Portunus trituberculatus TaxID=210409 RepID=A0A5B7E1F5_PORTR|nr:hypothetical protein [Portunus trituberculatus]